MSQASEPEIRAAIARVCRRLWERGLVAGQDGNVSVRIGADRILVTPAGFSKVDVTADDLVIVDLEGRHVAGANKASSEIAVHLRAYQRRDDIGAVVHAHPPTATGLSVAGETLPDNVLPEVTVLLGAVPLVRYAMPGTAELADQFEPYWVNHQAFLMANHGALTLGPTLSVAHQRMESVEHAARVLAAARTFGHVEPLQPTHVLALKSAHLKLASHD